MSKDIETLVAHIATALQKQGWLLAVGESCTGGLIAEILTRLPGSSSWFERGFVTYSNLSKQALLGVPATILEEHGAVSKATVAAMATGVLTHSPAQVSLATSGIAGPEGGTPDKPVGTVWFAWAQQGQQAQTAVHTFSGNRQQIREQAAIFALQGLLNRITGDDNHG